MGTGFVQLITLPRLRKSDSRKAIATKDGPTRGNRAHHWPIAGIQEVIRRSSGTGTATAISGRRTKRDADGVSTIGWAVERQASHPPPTARTAPPAVAQRKAIHQRLQSVQPMMTLNDATAATTWATGPPAAGPGERHAGYQQLRTPVGTRTPPIRCWCRQPPRPLGREQKKIHSMALPPRMPGGVNARSPNHQVVAVLAQKNTVYTCTS